MEIKKNIYNKFNMIIKNIIFIMFLLNLSICSAQIKDTITDKKCDVKVTYDKFTKTKSYTNSLYINNGMKSLGLDFIKIKDERGITRYAIFTNSVKGCVSPRNSYLYFLFSNGEVLKLNYKSEIHCGTSIASFVINELEMKLLLENVISDIRVSYDLPYDIVVNEKIDKKIKASVYCIINFE